MSLLGFVKKGPTHIDKNRPLEEVDYVVIDTELTGLNERRDSIVSIGAVRMRGGRIILSDTFYRLVRPAKDLTAESIIIHEITPSDVLEQPDIKKVFSEFLKFCGSDLLVGYFVNIDMEFLNREARKLLGFSMQNPVLDVPAIFELLISKKAFPEKDANVMPLRYDLYDIARFFDVPVNGAHNAMSDAFITAQLFQRFIPVLTGAGIKSIGELLKLSKKFKGGDRYNVARGSGNF